MTPAYLDLLHEVTTLQGVVRKLLRNAEVGEKLSVEEIAQEVPVYPSPDPLDLMPEEFDAVIRSFRACDEGGDQ